MTASLSSGQFLFWFMAFIGLYSLATLFYGQALWFLVPVIAGKGCVSGGICGAAAPVLGLWLKPLMLIAAAVIAVIAFARRGRAIGSMFWGLVPLSLMLPNLPSLFVLDSAWGTDFAGAILYFPRWSLFDLLPLLALGTLFCLKLEHMPGFAGSITRTRLFGSIPVGAIYIATCLWVSSDLVLALLPHAGVPVSQVTELHDVLNYPLSVAGGAIMAGLPPYGQPPQLVVSIATLVNLAAFMLLFVALAYDGSGRMRRMRQLASIHYVENGASDTPLFSPRRKTNE
ncbi:hypothetical protein [uncultured Hoeflea sp.]|uniref:hypothetical protein n=1 Tax=uncultured Hoeflea sp. TaxID=538666 RepID=UPI0026229BCA|nr:hypothetical protein [uncultured Hoeflea sp.]